MDTSSESALWNSMESCGKVVDEGGMLWFDFWDQDVR